MNTIFSSNYPSNKIVNNILKKYTIDETDNLFYLVFGNINKRSAGEHPLLTIYLFLSNYYVHDWKNYQLRSLKISEEICSLILQEIFDCLSEESLFKKLQKKVI